MTGAQRGRQTSSNQAKAYAEAYEYNRQHNHQAVDHRTGEQRRTHQNARHRIPQRTADPAKASQHISQALCQDLFKIFPGPFARVPQSTSDHLRPKSISDRTRLHPRPRPLYLFPSPFPRPFPTIPHALCQLAA